MAGCLAARTANHRSHEPPPCFALGVAPCATPSRSYHPMGCVRTILLEGSRQKDSRQLRHASAANLAPPFPSLSMA